MGNWGNNSLGIGDGSFADYPYFGTEKFAFIEDNCINNTSGNELNGDIDSDYGGRFVFRYNHCYDFLIGSHGSEGRFRGMRCAEVYNNDFHQTTANYAGGWRSGSALMHDNTWDGLAPTGGMNLQNYRTFFLFPGNTLGSSSGDGPWDVNVTEADGVTHIDGHSPYLFSSGTVTSGSTTTLTDTSKSWSTNQWAGYTAKRVSDNGIMSIISNTSNTLTGYYRAEQGGGVTWATGNSYQIHRVAISLDQPGRGKGDLIVGEPPTGTPAWPNEALEPCFEWNNVYTPTSTAVAHYQYGTGMYNHLLLVSGRDYYNSSSESAAEAVYVAALNGVAYTGPYTYPHPLAGGMIRPRLRPRGRPVRLPIFVSRDHNEFLFPSRRARQFQSRTIQRCPAVAGTSQGPT